MQKHVLWVEDDWFRIPELIDKFAEAGISVEGVGSLEEGRYELGKGTYDAVLLDMIMPERPQVSSQSDQNEEPKLYPGLDLLDDISGMEPDKRPRVVVLTIVEDPRALERINTWKRKGLVHDILLKRTKKFSDVVQSVGSALGAQQQQSCNGEESRDA